MQRRAFSLLEVVIVIGIIGVMAALSIPQYRDYQIRSDLDTVAQQVSQGLARAQLLAKSGERDSAWGFYVPAGILYKGASYATRDSNYDQTFPMPSTIAVNGLLDISYAKNTGTPSEVGNITLRALNDDQRQIQVTIAINRQTIATNTSDVRVICHHPLTDRQTLTIPESTLQTYLNQGDTLGACASASSASSVASSVASSAASSVAVSSSSSPAAGGGTGGSTAVCSKYSFNTSSQLVTLTAQSTVTFTNLLAELRFGNGGPYADVHACYTTNQGTSWSALFGGSGNCSGHGNAYGNAISPSGASKVRTLSSGTKFGLKVRGSYSDHGWLSFEEIYTSLDGLGHVIFLRNGDTLANYSVVQNQVPLRTYLSSHGYLNASGQITIGSCEILSIADFNDLGTSGADFQDDVMLMSFN